MKGIKRMFTLILLLFTVTMMQAQNSNFSLNANVGVGGQILDAGTSLHVGLNSHLSLSGYLGVEGQLSYTRSNVTSGFLTGDQYTRSIVNGLVGARLYLMSPEKRVRPYVNLMAGGAYKRETRSEAAGPKADFIGGFSFGGFVEIDQLVIGASLETYGVMMLKVGYTF